MHDRRLWIIFLIIFVNLLGFGIILPLLPYYAESFGASAITIGLLSGIYSLFQLLSAPILGELSDKYGRRPILLFSIGGTAVSFLLLGVANSIPLLFLSRLIDGASGGNISTAMAYIADISGKEKRTQNMGIIMAAFSLGFILGPATGGLLSVYGYWVPAMVAGVLATLATVLTYFFLPESVDVKKNVDELKKKRRVIFSLQDFRDALTHPDVGILMTVSFLMTLAFTLMQGTFALFTQNRLHFGAENNGLIFAYIGVIGVMIQMFGLKKILARFSEKMVNLLTILLMGVSLGLIGLAHNLPMLLLAVSLLAFGNNVSGPVVSGMISKATPDNEQGNVMGTLSSVGSLGRLIGPILGTFIYAKISPEAPYFLATTILMMTAGYYWWVDMRGK